MSVKQYVLLGAVVVCAVTGSFPAYAGTASWRNGTDSTVIVTYVVKYAFPGDHAVFNGANPVVSPPAVYVVPVVPGQYTSYNWGGDGVGSTVTAFTGSGVQIAQCMNG